MTDYVAPIDASEYVLADGRIVVPGESVDLSDSDVDEPHNKRLIESGQLIEVNDTKSSKKKKEDS